MNLSRSPFLPLAGLLAVAACADARAQHDHSRHDHPPSPAQATQATPATKPVDHAAMDHTVMEHRAMGHGAVDQVATGEATAAGAKPLETIPALTAADRAAAFPRIDHGAMDHAPAFNYFVQFNRMEAWKSSAESGQAWEGTAWAGTDLDRIWLRSEGEREHGRTDAAELEFLYGRSVSPWWDVLAGVKHDFRPDDSRTWAAVGLQGLAPYKFEIAGTAYFGESGQMAATLEIEYELLLTNRLILQPLVELSWYARNEPLRAIGQGVGKAEAGVRLRYEFDRRFAPYVGVVREQVFGTTADYRRNEGEGTTETRVVVGIRFWF